VKTLTISEAARDLATWLKQAIAGEDIAIRSDNNVVALRPIPSLEPPNVPSLSPREALRRLQQAAHLSPSKAESYLREVHAERLAGDPRAK
jgi:antitoxin (DNA-binding transcriptional repressor) of toxin-antitoxin stability system